MIYFIDSPYIKKLFETLTMHQGEMTLLPLSQLNICTHEDLIILDEKDIAHLPKHVHKIKILGEGQGMISKFQPYKEIAKLLLNVTFPVVFVTSSYLRPDLFHTLHHLWHRLDFDYLVDCTLSTENSFSLYTYAMNRSFVPEKKKKYAVINHIKDAINPPIEDLCTFIQHLKQTGSTLIFSAPIKGPLDLHLINLSDRIVALKYDGQPPFSLHELSSKPFYTIPITEEIQKDNFFEKHIENLISDIKKQWGGMLESL